MRHMNGRDLHRRRHAIVEQRLRDEVCLLVVGELLEQRAANALGHAAHDLAVDDQRIDQRSSVAHHGVVK